MIRRLRLFLLPTAGLFLCLSLSIPSIRIFEELRKSMNLQNFKDITESRTIEGKLGNELVDELSPHGKVVEVPTDGKEFQSQKVHQQQPDHQSKPIPLLQSPPACSCWNTSYHNCKGAGASAAKSCRHAIDECCRRTILCSHKMGFLLNKNLFRPWKTGLHVHITHHPPKVDQEFFSANGLLRHREVMVTRSFVDSIISGYLYHKSGRECWLDAEGRDPGGNKTFPMHSIDWEQKMAQKGTVPWKRTVPGKPVKGRSICEFLSSESEEVGMKAFADFAMGYWYSKIYDFYEKVQQQKQDLSAFSPRVLFVCYEDLSNSKTQRATFRKMMDFFIPGEKYDGRSDPLPKKTEYQGGHATDRDPSLRSRLRAIVEKLDKQVFNNWIATADRSFGCGVKQG